MHAQELRGKRAHDLLRKLQKVYGGYMVSVCWPFEVGVKGVEQSEVAANDRRKRVRGQIIPSIMPHERISSKQSLLHTDCCTNHTLLIFYLLADYILLNIPVSSYLDSCSSGWSWFLLIHKNVMRPLSNLPSFIDFSRNQTKVKSVFP